MFSSKLFAHKDVVRGLKNLSPALGLSNSLDHQTFYCKSLKDEFGSRQILTTPVSGISSQVDVGQPGKLVSCCLLTSHQGTCGHCSYCKFSLSSLETCGTAVALGGGVFKADCWNQPGWGLPVLAHGGLVEVAWWHLTWTGEVQGQAQPCCHLSSWTGQTLLALAFTLWHCLWALLGSVHTGSG